MKVYRHKKRGTTYKIIGEALLQSAQSTEDGLQDGDPMVVYQGEDGRLWVRMADEFYDGRFEDVSLIHTTS